MSNALVRKSLELLSYETDLTNDKRKNKKTKSSGVIDLIPANHRLICKDKKKGASSILKRTSKITIYEAKKQLEAKTDPTEHNIRKLLSLSSNNLDSDTIEKIICRAVKKPYKKKTKEEKAKEEEENRTVFTEEDFKKFEEEYYLEP